MLRLFACLVAALALFFAPIVMAGGSSMVAAHAPDATSAMADVHCDGSEAPADEQRPEMGGGCASSCAAFAPALRPIGERDLLLTALAFAIATPAAAQTAPADPDAGHTAAQHQAATSGLAAHQNSQAAPTDHSTMGHSTMDHSKHQDCCPKGLAGKGMPCCEKMKAGGSKMACCEKAAGIKGAADPHAGHDMSQR